MRQTTFEQAISAVNNRQFNEATTLLKPLLEAEERDVFYYKGLKLYADVIGPLTGHDYVTAIDMYQVIVNETEDDALYESAQVSILNSYLNLSMHYMETYENTRDIIEPQENTSVQLLEKLDDTRENFITQRAEAIYKARM